MTSGIAIGIREEISLSEKPLSSIEGFNSYFEGSGL
jgi:hypothetical protein